MSAECMVLLGGSFDPVHTGHVTIAEYFCRCFHTTQLRLIPAGNPWQKKPLKATPRQRIDMLRLAFDSTSLSITIDTQEIDRSGPGYSVDTLQAIRQEAGDTISLVFVIGTDQLLNLNTWHKWQLLFHFAHIAVATRPGFSLSAASLPAEIHHAFFSRLASPEAIRSTPSGATFFSEDLAIDISATEVRKTVQHSNTHHPLIPPKVLDYIVKNNLYRD